MTRPYFEASPDEIAKKLYFDLCGYYTPGKQEQAQDVKEIEEAIYYIKTLSENQYNNDCFRTFWNALQMIV